MGCITSSPNIKVKSISTSTSTSTSQHTVKSIKQKQSIKSTTSAIKITNLITKNNTPMVNNYKILSKLGKGSFGSVYKVQNIFTEKIYAMKVIQKYFVTYQDGDQSFLKEIEILMKVEHPNIIKIYEYYIDEINYYLIIEYVSGGELFDFISRDTSFTEHKIKKIMKQIFQALSYLHSNNIVHRDIKCENILIECSDDNGDNNDFNIKLIDFGTCNYISKNEHLTVKVGSPYYIAPEVLERNYNNKCDIWSAGVLLYILLIGFPPFNGKTQDDIFNSIQRGTINTQLPEWNKLSSLTKDFLLQLLCNDSTLRLSAQECLKHPWLQDESTSQYTYCSNETMQSVLSNIISFNAKEKLQQATIAYIVHFVYYSEDINNLKHVFQQLDTNNDGMLTFTEIKNGFDIYFGKAMSEIKLKEIVDNIDGNLDGVISYEEFLRFAIKKEELLHESHLKHAFDKFDINKDGKLSKSEITKVLRTSNLIYINNLIKEIDVNGDGFISYDEFKNLMNYILTGKEININVTTENNTTVINNKFIMNDNNNNNNVSSNNDISTLDSLNINSHIFDSKMYNSNNNLNNSVLGISIFVYNTKKNKCK